MKHFVDIENWVRRDNYRFFQGFDNCWYGITGEVDCTEAFLKSKEKKESFFLKYLFAALKAMNNVENMRYRKDNEGHVIFHDTIDVTTPIAVPGRTFYTVRVPYEPDFSRFAETAKGIISNIPEDGNPYQTDLDIIKEGIYDVFALSATPKLYFTSMSYTQREPGCALNYPLTNAGKVVKREGRFVMPFSITVSHEFVDGADLSAFFEKMEEYMREL